MVVIKKSSKAFLVKKASQLKKLSASMKKTGIKNKLKMCNLTNFSLRYHFKDPKTVHQNLVLKALHLKNVYLFHPKKMWRAQTPLQNLILQKFLQQKSLNHALIFYNSASGKESGMNS